MIKIIYDPIQGMCVPDGKAEAYANNLVSYGEAEIRVSTGLVIDYLRVAVCEGRLSLDGIEISFQHIDGRLEKLNLSKEGRIHPWPRGFNDYVESALCRLT